jgi:hypothetical protein
VPDDTKFDDFLRHSAKDYNTVTAPPSADAMWSRIEGDVAQAIDPARPRIVARKRASAWGFALAAGIAATLMIGVAVGRWTTRSTPTRVAVVTPVHPTVSPEDSARIAAHARTATLSHLADAEVFITTVRADLRAGRADVDRAERSRELLSRTRLLLGSETDRSPAVETLLQDLELLLAEIAALPPGRNSMDQKILDETMRQGNVLPRIRAALPAPLAGT